MSSSASEADLRARVLHTIRGLRGFFTVTQFRKAYKVRYAEKFSCGSVTTREYLKTFSELSFFEEEDKFSLNSIKVKIEEDSSSSDDDGGEDAPEEKEEMDETDTNDVETWYDQKEFQEILKAVKKELKANPDPSISEDDIRLFVKLHLLREMCLKVIVKVVQKTSDSSPPFFYIGDFSREWNSSHKDPVVPCNLFGLTLGWFLTSFLPLRKQGKGIFAICDELDGVYESSKTKSLARRIIDDGKKELVRQEESKRAESALRQKVLAMATRISQHSPVHGLHFRVSDFSPHWEHVYGEQLVPCAQFGFAGLSSYLESIPGLHRINRKIFAVRSSSQSEYAAESIDEEPSSAPKKLLIKRANGTAMEESAVGGEKTNEAVLRRKVLAMAQRLATYDAAGRLQFETKKLVEEWIRTEPKFIPYKELGFKNLSAFLYSFPELKNRPQFKYMFRSSQPLGNDADGSKDLGELKKTSGDDVSESDESESDDSDEEEEERKKKALATKKCSPKALPTVQKTVPQPKNANVVVKGGKKAPVVSFSSSDSDYDSESDEDSCNQKTKKAPPNPRSTADKVPIATDDSSEEDDNEVEKKKTEKKTLTVAQEIHTGQKTAQKLQKKAVETGKKARGVFSSSDDSDSDEEEEMAVKNVRKRENQSKVVREMGAQPKMNIKEKEKAEEEPKKKKAMKRSRSPAVIVLDDDEPSLKVPKVEIQETKETHLIGEEDQKAISSCGRATGHGVGMSGGCGVTTGPEGKGRAPGIPSNMDSSSSECMGSASGLLMSGAAPFFAPPPPYLPSKGEAAGRYMTFLLDQAEMKGLNVDEIAMEAINTINRKMAGK